MMEQHKGIQCVHPKSLEAWHIWLKNNHDKEASVWLILNKKSSGLKQFDIGNAIDEALCFGWVDSKSNSRDEHSYYVYFSKRNPKSNWSRINKNKIQKLEAGGRLQKAGEDMVLLARQSGTWDALNDVEDLIVPSDLMQAFMRHQPALNNWKAFPRSVKRATLEWIFNAKKPETRSRRIEETATQCSMNKRPNKL